MAEYWVGPSLRQHRPAPRWMVADAPRLKGLPSEADRRRARPLTPRRWRALVRLANIKVRDITFLARYAAHTVVLILTFTVGIIHGVDFTAYLQPAPSYNYVAETPEPMLWTTATDESTTYLRWSVLPQTVIPERPAAARFEPISYKVQAGDNPSVIAARFGLQPSSIVWANMEAQDNPDLLSIGQVLVIPPVDGVLHTVKQGDTLASLAEKYKVDPATIINFPGNKLQDADSPLVIGQQLMFPGGVRPYEAPKPATRAASTTSSSSSSSSSSNSRAAASSSRTTSNYAGSTGCCIWPVRGRITQQPWSAHMALDIAAPTGTPVYASDGGRVIRAGWDNTGYGYRVIVDHGGGIHTLYAHFSYYYVDVGDYVNKGELIGRVGSTGRSTGPHLHFEVRRGGVRQNPWNWLP